MCGNVEAPLRWFSEWGRFGFLPPFQRGSERGWGFVFGICAEHCPVPHRLRIKRARRALVGPPEQCLWEDVVHIRVEICGEERTRSVWVAVMRRVNARAVEGIPGEMCAEQSRERRDAHDRGGGTVVEHADERRISGVPACRMRVCGEVLADVRSTTIISRAEALLRHDMPSAWEPFVTQNATTTHDEVRVTVIVRSDEVEGVCTAPRCPERAPPRRLRTSVGAPRGRAAHASDRHGARRDHLYW